MKLSSYPEKQGRKREPPSKSDEFDDERTYGLSKWVNKQPIVGHSRGVHRILSRTGFDFSREDTGCTLFGVWTYRN